MTTIDELKDRVTGKASPEDLSDDVPGGGAPPGSFLGGVRELFTSNIRQSGIAIAFVAIVALFSMLNENFLSPGNLTNIVLQYSYILILAVGMALVIIGGHIDLSVGSLVAFTGAVAAVVVIRGGQPWWVGVLAALAVGLLAGVWQGFWVAYVGIPSFIVTLAGMLLFRGLTFRTLDNISLSPFGGTYYNIANGFQQGILNEGDVDLFTMLIFAIAVGGYAVAMWRSRAGKVAYNQRVESMPSSSGRSLAWPRSSCGSDTSWPRAAASRMC